MRRGAGKALSSSSAFVPRGVEQYDGYMGRWSRRLAPLFLDFAGTAAGDRILEVGCGTGSLTFELAQRPGIAAIEAIDYEPNFVEAVRARNSDPRISVSIGDACDLQFPPGRFDRVLSLLVLHFVTDADKAIAEMRRVLRPGGVAAAAVWDNFGGTPSVRMFWDSVAAVEPSGVSHRDAAAIRPMTQSGELRAGFANAGFANVVETMLTIRQDFVNFHDYWLPMITGQGAHARFFGNLPVAAQQHIESTVRAAYLCGRPDGPRGFASVAWAVRGEVAK